MCFLPGCYFWPVPSLKWASLEFLVNFHPKQHVKKNKPTWLFINRGCIDWTVLFSKETSVFINTVNKHKVTPTVGSGWNPTNEVWIHRAVWKWRNGWTLQHTAGRPHGCWPRNVWQPTENLLLELQNQDKQDSCWIWTNVICISTTNCHSTICVKQNCNSNNVIGQFVTYACIFIHTCWLNSYPNLTEITSLKCLKREYCLCRWWLTMWAVFK